MTSLPATIQTALFLSFARFGSSAPRSRTTRQRHLCALSWEQESAWLLLERYLIFYTTDADLVRIEPVLHGARDIPGLFDA